MKRKWLCLTLIFVFIFTALFSGCRKQIDARSSTEVHFDTSVTLTAYEQDVPEEAWELCRKFDKLFSATDKESELYLLNQKGSYTVSDETLEVIKEALEYCRITEGKFDITVRPVSELWNFTAKKPALPKKKDLEAALSLVDYTKIKIEGNTVTLPEGVKIDLGAIAKGYIADKLYEVYQKNSVSGIIDLGGNIMTVGKKPGHKNFLIGIKKPFSEEDENWAIIELSSGSVVTCGVYERCFELDGVRYHHILDTKTGKPLENGLDSVTVIAPDSSTADALSTSLFLMGEKKALETLKTQKNVYAIFIKTDGTYRLSEGLLKEGSSIYIAE